MPFYCSGERGCIHHALTQLPLRRVKLKHDMYLIRGSVGTKPLFLPIRRKIFWKKKKKTATMALLKFQVVCLRKMDAVPKGLKGLGCGSV